MKIHPKTILFSAYLILIAVVLFGCKQPESRNYTIKNDSTVVFHKTLKKQEFHVKVEAYGWDYYAIRFTGDNWATTETVMKTFDISSPTDTFNVCHQLYLGYCEEAQAFAKQFTSYDKAIFYNMKVKKEYDSLVNYRANHPIRKQEIIITSSQPTCDKEILIY